MLASVLDLRNNMKKIKRALERNETVTLLNHGKIIGKIIQFSEKKLHLKVQDHPFFGSKIKTDQSVEQVMTELRGKRY